MNTPILFLALALTAAAPESLAPVLTLEDALREAQAKNLDLKQAQARLKQTEEISRKVWSNYLPQLTAGGSYTRNQTEARLPFVTGYRIRDMSGVPGFSAADSNGPAFDPTRPFDPENLDSIIANPPGTPSNYILTPAGYQDVTIQQQNQWGGQIQLNQAILVPALWPAISNAYLAEKVAAVSVENARREILFAVAQVYYGAASLKEVVEVQRRLLQNNLDHEKDARVRVEAGTMPRIALLRAQIDRARAEQDLQRAEMSYLSMRIALGTLLDREGPFEVARPQEVQIDADLTELEQKAESKRPDLEAARLSRDLADQSHDATYYKYLPNLVGSAVYRLSNVKGFTNEYGQWALMLMANWTLWDGGLRESELRENEAKLVEAEAALRSAKIKARDEVRRAMLDLQSARANRIKAEEQTKLARENMQLTNVNYQAGAATQLEVSDANTALAASEMSLVTESLNAQLSALRLLKAAGEFDPK